MKFLIFLSLFFYQTLHANILYPLPTHKFDFSISTYNYNSSNPSKKRTLASIIDRINTAIDNFLVPLVSPSIQSIQLDKNVYIYSKVLERDLKGVKYALKIGADPTYIELDYFFKDITKLTETEQKIIEIIKEAQRIYHLKDQLNYGVRYTNLDNVIKSLEQGADPNHRLHLRLPYLIQLALRYRDLIQEPPLTEENEKIVEALLKHGANPNLHINDLPALHLAVFLRNPKIVKLLIKYGANVNLKYNKDLTPLLLVVDPLRTKKNFKLYISVWRTGEFEIRKQKNLELDKEITQALLDAGANINEKTSNGDTLLVSATVEGHFEFASFLINKGANLEEAIETIKTYQNLLKNKNTSLKSLNIKETFSHVGKAIQVAKNTTAIQFLEDQKAIQQTLKKQLSEIKSPKNDKTSCPGAFG